MPTTEWARVEAGTVREIVTSDPAGRYHAELEWLPIPAGQACAPGWTWDGASFRAPVPNAPTAVQAKAFLDAMLAAKESLGVHFQAAGQAAASLFPTDPGAQLKLVSAFTMAGAGLWVDGTPWITADGKAVPLTRADVQALATKAAAYVAACTAHYASLLPTVAANPAARVDLGWPANS